MGLARTADRRLVAPTEEWEFALQTAWIALAGAIGAVARYRIGVAIGVRSFPWATLVVNVVGSFLLALLLAGPGTSRWSPATTAALAIGLLGAFTTFSTFGYETFTLVRTGREQLAVVYVSLSLIGALGATALGYVAGRALV
jgi:CrcB protein